MTKSKNQAAPKTGAASSSKKTAAKKTATKVADTTAEAPQDPVTIQEEITQEASAQDQSNSPVIVIPYKGDAAKGDELRYALRAWAKHLPEANIVIIGDREDWFSDDIAHIPHRSESTNPQVDVAHKMIAAIGSGLVPVDFIWTNDDIYTLCPVLFEDIAVLKAHGRLTNKGTKGSLYHENAERTLKALKDAGIEKPYDFATHTPVILEKSALAKVIKDFNCDKEGHLIYTIYANLVTHFGGYRPIITRNDAAGSICASVYRSNVDPELLGRVMSDRKWVNNNDGGWAAVEPQLKKLFPQKSRFEK
jgi:hypothetical protein